MAIKLRASEKRILQQTMKAIQEEMGKLPQVVDVATGEILAAGRSFDVLKSTTTKSKTAAVPELDSKTFVKNVAKQIETFVEVRDSNNKEKKATKSSKKASNEEEEDDDDERPSMSIAERRRRRRSG